MKLLLDGVWQGTGFGPEEKPSRSRPRFPGVFTQICCVAAKFRIPYWRDQAQCARWIEWNWSFERTFVVEQVPTAAQLCALRGWTPTAAFT